MQIPVPTYLQDVSSKTPFQDGSDAFHRDLKHGGRLTSMHLFLSLIIGFFTDKVQGAIIVTI